MKDDLNLQRVANGVIPVADARYGIRAFQQRAKGARGTQGLYAGEIVDRGEDEDDVEAELEVEVGVEIEDEVEHEFAIDDEVGVEHKDRQADGEGMDVDVASPAAQDLSRTTELQGATPAYVSHVKKAGEKEGWASLRSNSRAAPLQEDETRSVTYQRAEEEEVSLSGHIAPTVATAPSKDAMDVDEPAQWLNAPEAVMDVHPYRGMEMPPEVLFNIEALRLWTFGFREQAVEKAQETKEYMNDFVLRPEDFD